MNRVTDRFIMMDYPNLGIAKLLQVTLVFSMPALITCSLIEMNNT
jgi:hypothetical protein